MPDRHDLYGPIHKGLRFGTAHLLIRLGNLDWRDAEQASALLAALRLHLALAKEHLEHEDAEYHPSLRARVPSLATELDRDHAHHYEAFAELERLIAAAEAADPSERAVAARALYLRFTIYFAEDLAHMEREEQVALPLFHAQFDDQELMAMEGRIIALIEPDRLVQYYYLMLPGMNPAERATFLRYVRAGAPPEAYRQLVDEIARDALPPRDYQLLIDDLAEAA